MVLIKVEIFKMACCERYFVLLLYTKPIRLPTLLNFTDDRLQTNRERRKRMMKRPRKRNSRDTVNSEISKFSSKSPEEREKKLIEILAVRSQAIPENEISCQEQTCWSTPTQ